LSSGTAATAIQLEAGKAHGVNTYTNGAFGIAGLVTEQEALCPLFSFALGCSVMTEITIHVKVAQLQAGFAVFDEGSLRWNGQSQTQCAEAHGLSDCFQFH